MRICTHEVHDDNSRDFDGDALKNVHDLETRVDFVYREGFQSIF